MAGISGHRRREQLPRPLNAFLQESIVKGKTNPTQHNTYELKEKKKEDFQDRGLLRLEKKVIQRFLALQ